MDIVTDYYADCLDFWQLCCGAKGVPSDKNSRLSILSVREGRFTGCIRYSLSDSQHDTRCTDEDRSFPSEYEIGKYCILDDTEHPGQAVHSQA
eukprot:2370957-Pyramimonas_sp.AAC.1